MTLHISYFRLPRKTFPKAPRLIGFKSWKSAMEGAHLDTVAGFLMNESEEFADEGGLLLVSSAEFLLTDKSGFDDDMF